MQYLGGKARASRWLSQTILDATPRREVLVEPS